MSTEPQEPEVLDPLLLENLRALQDPGDPDLAHELITLFLRDSTDRVVRIREAAARGDQPAVADIAHQLKGSAGVLGAIRFQESASQLEQAARSRQADAAALAALAGRVAQAFDEVRAALARLGFS